MKENEIKQIIFDALIMINHAREDDEMIEISETTKLFGNNGSLDSMGLVGFLIDVEESLMDNDINLSLSDERAMSQTNSPFRDVPSLTSYIIDTIGQPT